MRRFDVEGFDAARYVREHRMVDEEDDHDPVDCRVYSQRSLEPEPVFSASTADHPIGYAQPNYGQGSAYQRQPTSVYPPGAKVTVKRPPDNVVYHYDPATQTYVATAAPPSLAASMRLPASAGPRVAKKIMLAPAQASRAAPAPASASPLPARVASPQAAVPPPTGDTAAGLSADPMATTASIGYTPPASRQEVAKWPGDGKWVVSSGSACCQAPCTCLGACFCPWCMVCSQRGRLLGNDWSRYRCCAGLCGQRECCDDGSGRCGICCEAVFCCPCALHSNRFILQKQYNLKRSCCDRCVADMACCCNDSDTCCAWCGGSLCDCWYACAFPCLLTQQYCQLKAATTAVPTFTTMS